MPRQQLVAGLDVGSSQITCVLGKEGPAHNTLEIISVGQKQCPGGIKAGTVVDIDVATDAIKFAIEQAEEKADEIINQLYLGISGLHIETHNSRGVISISRADKEITSEDVTGAIENAKAIQISSDREIIDTISQEYSLDRQKGVHNPVGMEGHFLEVYAHIITASVTHLNNVYKAIAKAGFNVIEPIYGLMALGDIVITNEEKELGCLLIDFGGQLTGLAIYTEGSIKFSKELNFGMDFITRDISHSFKTSLAQAQFIKEQYGLTIPSLIKKDEEFEFMSVDGRTRHKSTLKELAEKIAPRLEEMLERIKVEIENTAYYDYIGPGGIILTGGGSLMNGLTTACEKILDTQTRLGLPQNVTGKSEIISNPSYSTAIGLIKYRPQIETGRKQFLKTSLLKKLRDWL